ncbi:hypothetical protein NQ176_g6603 [Zarea fungicola]|uniref:Uncharacterized protein n=1 Tax=Zarea fungicola TaxID=93591 RepID=A0ACC1N2Z8_9HYPO|nr:hypothetical protein NQ176_g6603 [Lecanicillium fungicola]
MPQTAQEKEVAVKKCLEYLDDNPDAKVHHVAARFGVTRSMLRRRLAAVPPQLGRRGHNKKLSEDEEEGILRDMRRLDDLNLCISKKWITDAANGVLKARETRTNATPAVVGLHWVDRFISRYNLEVYEGKIRFKDSI